MRSARRPRIGVVGHFTWFSNHFPEGWESDPDILCLDVDETDYRFLLTMANFRPDVTLFYRPELYPRRYVDLIPGRKLAFLSEPVPPMIGGELVSSAETDLRLQVYRGMSWAAYDAVLYYDTSKRETIARLGWPVTSFRPLPLDTSHFWPGDAERPIDVCFVGKATAHRIEVMDFLRLAPVKFVWVAHGASGKDLADLFRRSKVVLNIHADALPALEPRIHLAASCGCAVLSEPFSGETWPFADQVGIFDGPLTLAAVRGAMDRFATGGDRWRRDNRERHLSARALLDEHLDRVMPAAAVGA